MDQKVTEFIQADHTKVQMIKDHVHRLTESLSAMRMAREIHDERRHKELKMMENNVTLELHRAREDSKTSEAKVEERGRKLCIQLSQELKECKLLREQEQNDDQRRLSTEVDKLHEILQEQISVRLEYGDRIEASLQDSFRRLEESIEAEKKQQYNTTNEMMQTVQEVQARMHGELLQEKKERESVQNKLLGLLEDTCMRIEASITPSSPPCGSPYYR